MPIIDAISAEKLAALRKIGSDVEARKKQEAADIQLALSLGEEPGKLTHDQLETLLDIQMGGKGDHISHQVIRRKLWKGHKFSFRMAGQKTR